MAPECTSNLAVLDLKVVGSEVEGEMDRLDVMTAVECLHVSWNATERPDGADPMGDNVVFVWRPPGYYRRTYRCKPDLISGAFSWVHPVQHELMMVLALPPGYVLPSVDDAKPTFVRCKELPGQGRMAVYWILSGGSRAQVSWSMERSDRPISAHLAALNDEASKRPRVSTFGTIIDGTHVERPQPPPTTFVIHGRDHAGVEELRDCIKQLGLLPPVVMKDELVKGCGSSKLNPARMAW